MVNRDWERNEGKGTYIGHDVQRPHKLVLYQDCRDQRQFFRCRLKVLYGSFQI
jgi:hypothetical protein